MSDTEKVLWHDVITHGFDGQLHKQRFGPDHVVLGSEHIVELKPGQTVVMRLVGQPKPDMGYYWVRKEGYIKPLIAFWSGERWMFTQPSRHARDLVILSFESLEILSTRLEEPAI